MLLHFVAVPTTETNELRRNTQLTSSPDKTHDEKKLAPAALALLPHPLPLPRSCFPSQRHHGKYLTSDCVTNQMSFFPIIEICSSVFQSRLRFIILAVKESRILSFFKSHTLFLLVDELCFTATFHRSPWLRRFTREKISQKSPEFPEIMKRFFFMSETM